MLKCSLFVQETNEYLLLHVSDFIKKNNYEVSKKYLIGACIIQYTLELGKDGLHLFFYRCEQTHAQCRRVD